MEISSNTLLPYGYPAQQNAHSPETTTPFRQQVTEREQNETATEFLPLRKETKSAAEPTLDYRQLLRQARYQQAGARPGASPQREAQPVGIEPLQVQRALGAYQGTADLQDGGGELMPRLDNYV